MQLIAPAHVDSPFHFTLRQPERTPNPLLRLDDAAAGYQDREVLSGLRLTIAPGDRLGLLGRNGAGKSTLIKVLAGGLAPMRGERLPAAELRVGYFAQHQLEQLDPVRTPLEHLFDIDPGARESDLRKWLGGFGFSGDTVFMPTRPFSGGEKSRLALALLVYRRPNLLLLDEPTNHLDLEMRQALAVALQDFAGAMVIVSHDRHLLRVATDQLLLVDGGAAAEFDGSLDDYRSWLAGRERQGEAASREAAPHGRAARQDRRRRDAADRQRLRDLNQRLRHAESALAETTRRNSELERALADPDLYQADNSDRLRRCLERQAENRSALERAEAAWLAASEELDSLQKTAAGQD
jgi:ATP-binding cassette subfamily F protein 3